MIKIAAISDTHLKGYDRRIDEIVSKHFADADIFVHAGDIVWPDVLDSLYMTGKAVYAVSGNMDPLEVKSRYPVKAVIQVEEVKIGLIHGWGSPEGIRHRIRQEFDHADAIIYGHTHQPFSGIEAGILFFNPGSVFDSRFTMYNSVGIITVEGKKISGEIITL